MSPKRSGSAKSLAYHASIGTLLHNAISWTDMATVTPRAVVHQRAGEWPQELANGSISLDFDHRHRRRFRLVTDQGDEILLDLPTAIAMADRDGLQLDDGTWFVVRAAAEPVVDVAHPEPGQLLRLAWHLGNRHVPTEIRTRTLRIRPDHVIEAMLRGFGADTRSRKNNCARCSQRGLVLADT